MDHQIAEDSTPTPRAENGGDVDRLLSDPATWAPESEGSVDELVPRLFEELRAHAAALLRHESNERTLQPTALVHEAYIKLARREDLTQVDRYRFFAAASEAMRRVLIDRARGRGRQKRGGGWVRHARSVEELALSGDAGAIEGLDRAFAALEAEAPEMAEVFRFRVFAGLSVEQCAEVLGIGTATVKRRWAWARAWMADRVSREGGSR
ncbi:MAG: ECF-type sigma factor [Planctomycetota bacterium]